MDILSIDIETYSDIDLRKSGVYKYVESDNFEILIFSYAINGFPFPSIDLTVDVIPPDLIAMIEDDNVEKTAFNAAFERICLSKYLGYATDRGQFLNPKSWKCTMVSAARAGYPLSLDVAAKAIGLTDLKDSSGKALIGLFSVPCKPTKANGGRTRNLPSHFPEKFAQFMRYCDQDVLVEQGVKEHTGYLPVNEMEDRLWVLDQQINDRGVYMDVKMIVNALNIHADYVDQIYSEACDLTGLDNPNSPRQLIDWLLDNEIEVENLRKTTVADLLKEIQSDVVGRVLQIRQEMAKTSVKKYTAMRHVTNRDHRARGLFQYYGANRTGRWSGRLIQMQNLTKHYMKDVDLARDLVRHGDGFLLEMCFGNVPDVLSQLIRTVFIAAPGKVFTVVDFSAIEARVLAWLAGEEWRLEIFRTHGQIYEASASKMFGVTLESVLGEKKDKAGNIIRPAGENYHLRAKGKIAELALGYQGWINALIQMGALAMGLDEEELGEVAGLWRQENKKIVEYWRDVEFGAKQAIQRPGHNIKVGYVTFFSKRGNLYVKLPSGRYLCYVNARIKVNRHGKMGITYWGMDQRTKKWSEQDTYGGKITENITQAIARDCLGVALIRIDDAGFPIVGHVHDEAIIEHTVGVQHEVEELISAEIDWAPGLPLGAEGFVSPYYKK